MERQFAIVRWKKGQNGKMQPVFDFFKERSTVTLEKLRERTIRRQYHVDKWLENRSLYDRIRELDERMEYAITKDP